MDRWTEKGNMRQELPVISGPKQVPDTMLAEAQEREAEELRRDHPVFTQDGEDREECPNQHIANMHDGATAGFKYFPCRKK